MFRAKLEYQLNNEKAIQERSLVVKSMPQLAGEKRDMLAGSSFFETEIGMYTETLPLIEQILSKHGDNTKFAPK